MEYSKHEAKEWARAHMQGVCNVIMPTFTSDLRQLNEQAIRHDVRRNIQLGFWGALVVAECGTTREEYKRFLDIVVDEGKGKLRAVVHGNFDTMTDVVEICRYAEGAGAAALLLTYPPTFYPRSDQDIYDYSAGVMNQTSLATVLFAVHQWNFARVHEGQISVDLADRLADLPNAVAVKAEGEKPGIGSVLEMLDRCGDRLLISDPREFNAPAWYRIFDMQWMGTSNFECYGGTIPRYVNHLRRGEVKEAMQLYWQIHPMRATRSADLAASAGAQVIHRFSWKYQGWLNGYNGGPLRMPTMRLSDSQANRLHAAAIKSRLIPADAPGDLDSFYLGRNPA